MRTCLFPICLAIFGCNPDSKETIVKPNPVVASVVYDQNSFTGNWTSEQSTCSVQIIITQNKGRYTYVLKGKLISESGPFV